MNNRSLCSLVLMRLHHNDVILTTEISRDEELLLINVWDGRLGNFLNNHLQREGERQTDRGWREGVTTSLLSPLIVLHTGETA